MAKAPKTDPEDVAPDADEPGDETLPADLEEFVKDEPAIPDNVDQEDETDE